MAKPRVFLSSTYYDLKSIRGEIERFVRDKGYDPVLNERGNVTFTKEVSPETSCYREIETCDILISIVGGRFGNTSENGFNSISQVELQTALDQYKQVYIFVDRDVYSEYRTYLKNKTATVEWSAVDNVKIYQFLDDIFALPNNNAVMPFETAHDIISLLREQWAGLFQRMLQSQSYAGALATAQELRQGVETARKLVELLRSEEKGSHAADVKFEAILLPNHASFSRIKKLLKVPYRVYFTTLDELNSWLNVRNYKEIDKSAWDKPSEMEWYNLKDVQSWDLLKISATLFDEEGRFIPDSTDWSDKLIRREIRPREVGPDDDDDIPF